MFNPRVEEDFAVVVANLLITHFYIKTFIKFNKVELKINFKPIFQICNIKKTCSKVIKTQSKMIIKAFKMKILKA